MAKRVIKASLESKQLQSQLIGLSKKAGKSIIGVTVGYTANYAVHVHENAKMEARRRLSSKRKNPRAQWKFLEQPARELQSDMTKIVRASMKKIPDMEIALGAAGLLLQRESQLLVPVDTGNLKGSAFTRLDDGTILEDK